MEDSPSDAGGCAVLPVKREVIQDKLLAALDDKSKVACLFSEDDLDLLIEATKNGGLPGTMELFSDLWTLRQAAFGAKQESVFVRVAVCDVL